MALPNEICVQVLVRAKLKLARAELLLNEGHKRVELGIPRPWREARVHAVEIVRGVLLCRRVCIPSRAPCIKPPQQWQPLASRHCALHALAPANTCIGAWCTRLAQSCLPNLGSKSAAAGDTTRSTTIRRARACVAPRAARGDVSRSSVDARLGENVSDESYWRCKLDSSMCQTPAPDVITTVLHLPPPHPFE